MPAQEKVRKFCELHEYLNDNREYSPKSSPQFDLDRVLEPMPGYDAVERFPFRQELINRIFPFRISDRDA